jgi:hypothetical protein
MGVHRIRAAHYKNQWPAVMNAVLYRRVPERC